MTPAEAAWVREHVFTKPMRKSYGETPGFYTTCACQHGLTHWCQVGAHGRCHRGTPQRSYESIICWRGGQRPAYFAEPYQHASDVFATGPRRDQYAMVWLADRVCRWVCPCPCHSAPPEPIQLDLFAEAIA